MGAIFETKNLSAGYRKGKKETVVLKGLNLKLECGSLVSLLGANGIGKSTLLRTVSGIQPSLEGEVIIDGKNINSYSPKQLSKLISIVSTDRTQAGGLTVSELASLGRQPHTGFLGRLDEDDKKIVDEALEAVGIAHKRNSFVAELSDGERQKAMIAKALAQEAPIILLDEPTAFLDVSNRISTLQLLHDLARKEQRAILLSSHDVSQSLALSDRLWLLYADGTMTDGVPEDLIFNGKMDKLYKSDSIQFDRNAGDYESLNIGNRTIALNCENSLLKIWIANALRRNGFVVDNNAPTVIDAKDAKNFTLQPSGKVANSVEQLLELINIH